MAGAAKLLAPLLLVSSASAGDPPAALGGFEARYAPQAEDGPAWRADRADDFAPIGVLGERLLAPGEWWLALRYTTRQLTGNLDGRDGVSTQELFDRGYQTAPTELSVSELTLAAMYGLSDRLTLMATLPYLWKRMEQDSNPAQTLDGAFATEASGLGDLDLSLLYGLVTRPHHRALLSLGLGLPTGSVDERDAVPGNPSAKLPYPMQLGSGSFELTPGAAYTGQSAGWSWGAQFAYTVRLDQNQDEYTLGSQLDLQAWGARRWSDAFSTSLRLAWSDWDEIDGRDPELPTTPDAPGFLSPAADPALQGGNRLDLGLGATVLTGGALRGNRFGLEVLLPLRQDLDGPQLETDWTLIAGWQLAF